MLPEIKQMHGTVVPTCLLTALKMTQDVKITKVKQTLVSMS